MTITYNVSQDGQLIETFPKGVLNIKETIDYFNRLKNDTRIKKGSIEVVYFNYVTDFNISYSDSIKIIESYQEPKAIQLIDMTIFLCETELSYGIGRMLQTVHEITNPNHNVLVLRSKNELENAIKNV